MKSLLIAIISLTVCGHVFAAESKKIKDCWESAETQHELNICASSKAQAADKELNRLYKAIQNRYKNDPMFLNKLKSAQLAWIKFRDAQLAMMYPHKEESGYYGSDFPMCLNSYLEKLTVERVATLKKWLTEPEEGDTCAGSMKRS